MTLPKGKRAPELKKRQLRTAQRPPTSGNACRNLRVQRRRIPAAQDIVTVRQLREMLGISRQLAYDLINDGELQAIKIGNSFKIPKVSVINFVTEEKKEVKFSA